MNSNEIRQKLLELGSDFAFDYGIVTPVPVSPPTVIVPANPLRVYLMFSIESQGTGCLMPFNTNLSLTGFLVTYPNKIEFTLEYNKILVTQPWWGVRQAGAATVNIVWYEVFYDRR